MRKVSAWFLTFSLIFALTACSGGQPQTTNAVPNSTSAAAATTAIPGAIPGASSVAAALAENSEIHAEAEDYVWESSAVIQIELNGDAITVAGEGVTVAGSQATITSAGTYSLSGSLADGQICVDADDQAVVRLILNGVTLHNSAGAPLNFLNAEKVVLILADHTENSISDGATYVFANAEEDEPNAAIFSKTDLTIAGNGALTVQGNYNDGIASKDGLLIVGGTLTVTAADDGIRGKDYLAVQAGTLTVTAQGDGLKSDNEEDAARGYILIETGDINVTAGGDALTAQTDVLISAGTLTLVTGGGSQSRLDENTSAKGIKALVNLTIDAGALVINAADDALHSNGSLTINAGTFSLASGDDGVHADATLTVNGGDLRITQAYEGLESAVITINAGEIHVVASDDGINVASGNDASGANPGWGRGPGGGGGPGRGGGPGQDTFTYSGADYLYIHGGYIVVEAAGDGIDVNGAIEMTDGVVLVNGPTEQMNGALDYDGGFKMTGGFLVAAGSVGMALAPGSYSNQYSVLINLTAAQPAGTLFHIQNSAGEEVLTFAPTKAYQSIAFSAPTLAKGATYTVYTGGSSTGTVTDGLYQAGAYTAGTPYTNFTISSVVTSLGGGGHRP